MKLSPHDLLICFILIVAGCQPTEGEDTNSSGEEDATIIAPPPGIVSTASAPLLRHWLPPVLALPDFGAGSGDGSFADDLTESAQLWTGQVEECFDADEADTQVPHLAVDSCFLPFAGGIQQSDGEENPCLLQATYDTNAAVRQVGQAALDLLDGAFCSLFKSQTTVTPPAVGEAVDLSSLLSDQATSFSYLAGATFTLTRWEETAGDPVYVTTVTLAGDSERATPRWWLRIVHNPDLSSPGAAFQGVVSIRMGDVHESTKELYQSIQYVGEEMAADLSSGRLLLEVRQAAMTPKSSPFLENGLFNPNAGAVFDEPDGAAFGSYGNDAENLVIEDQRLVRLTYDFSDAKSIGSLWTNRSGYYFENTLGLQIHHTDAETSSGCVVAGVASLEHFGTSIRRSLRESDRPLVIDGTQDTMTEPEFSSTVQAQCYVDQDDVFVLDSAQIDLDIGYLELDADQTYLDFPDELPAPRAEEAL